MTNGVNRKSGRKVSVETGDPKNFTSYEEFKEAVKNQLRYAIRAVVEGSHIIDNVCMDRIVPALSLSFRDCIQKCSDYAWGGAKYNTGNGIIMIGVADLINSMAAVKNLVYGTRQISMKELILALDVDFEGYDAIKKLCDDAPKYGNDNDATNEMAGETFIANEIESYRSKFGTMTPGILPVSGKTPFGLEVGALPSGRHAWKPLADRVSPNGGTDTEGPGAVLKSVSHLPHDRFVQGTLLNMKIELEMLNSENGIMQMMALLKSMCSLGIFHVQFNVIDRETLLATQERPEEYRGLLIRVAGYTAYFTELGKDVQDEIIARTEQESLYGCSVG